MVLHSVVGDWKFVDEVGIIETEAGGGLPFLLFSCYACLFPPRATVFKALRYVSFEVLLPWQKRAFARFVISSLELVLWVQLYEEKESKLWNTVLLVSSVCFHFSCLSYLSLIWREWFLCRCNIRSLRTWASYRESESVDYPRWKSDGSVFHHWHQVYIELYLSAMCNLRVSQGLNSFWLACVGDGFMVSWELEQYCLHK